MRAKGIHKKFVYSSQKFYIFPELGANWHKYKIANYGYGVIVGATLKQIITGNARAGWRAVTKFWGKSALLTGFINFGLINLEYEVRNNVIRVKEKAGARKDRYSSLSYNIYVSKMIEREETETNAGKALESMVLEFRAPRIKKKY